jgi:formate dehydrogenase major subunit
VPGLGARLGRGGATTTLQSLGESDCIVIMGANMAENHPVGFRFVTQAQERGATVIHIDPRFSRTSAMADLHVPLRAGSDLVFLGALINHVLNDVRWLSDAFFRRYLRVYTNAALIVGDDYRDTEDLDGLFSGYNPETRRYDPTSWVLTETEESTGAAHQPEQDQQAHEGEGGGAPPGAAPRDPTLADPRCVFQVLRRHFARYTPEMVERACGVPPDLFLKVADAVLRNSGADRTTAFAYAVAWTQHTTGSQMIGACAILQLLLGNIGRPGGGILALRGHASIQGSTDIPTLYNLLPGYLPMPTATDRHATLDNYLESERLPTGLWYNVPAYMISLLKAWYGPAATADNGYCYDLLPRIDDDHSFQWMITAMRDGVMKGLFCMGQNPAVGGQNTKLARRALGELDWLVVRDVHEIESAAFWYDAPEVRAGEISPRDIKTEIFLLPAAIGPEKEGTFTNTQRLIQWHDKGIAPPGDARSEAGFMVELGRRLKELYAGDDSPRGRQLAALTWDYPTDELGEPDLDVVVKEINGYTVADRKVVANYNALKDDGSTACGCWIYSGIMPEEGRNRAKERQGDGRAALGWGYAWPNNVRLLYNRAAADPDGTPWSERKAWVWWDADAGRWAGHDIPDFPPTKAPDYQPPEGAQGLDAHPGDAPFVRLMDGLGALFAREMKDGPLPTHYEPWESPARNALYPGQDRNPAAIPFQRGDNPYHAIGDPHFPHILTTYRLTEHLTAGGMTRWVPWLAELQPEGFAEISTELADELGIGNGDRIAIATLRGEITTRALVTRRLRPLRIDGRTMHQVGLPWHFGFGGIATGAIANDLSALIEDPNSRIHEGKSFTCSVRKVTSDE